MVQGLDAFNRRFKAVPEKVRAAAIRALEKGAEELVADMRRLAPVGDYPGAGDLRDSIGWTWGEAPKGTIAIGRVGGREFGTLRITIYAGGRDAFYARFQEFGTVKMAANPFFYPVYRARRRRVRSRITREISKAIRQA